MTLFENEKRRSLSEYKVFVAYGRRTTILSCPNDSAMACDIVEGGIDGDDLLPDPPSSGIWVFDCKETWDPGSWEYPQEGSMYYEGSYRQPTEEEWAEIRNGFPPIEFLGGVE